jgi:hypothetical protein
MKAEILTNRSYRVELWDENIKEWNLNNHYNTLEEAQHQLGIRVKHRLPWAVYSAVRIVEVAETSTVVEQQPLQETC